ncbi:MCE family protein [Mycolicibacter kumamotonensis]|uniref:MCE family protein n=1 Tax=Mycolicibacter kumamotonensis TaxID=354243 RepID=A0A7K3LBG2_9MYCO|nr:MCE family protein [Mycolicibacter kumamotonensis]NDJ89699.1 MCE family protein [Mycolicibacter kumamotonensis]
MKSFAERNLFVVGAVGMALVAGIIAVALQYHRLPFVDSAKRYSAHFAEVGGLRPGVAVQVAGHRVGKVSSIELDGARVLVKFTVDRGVHLGERTEAQIRTKSLLGAKVLQVTPRGDGQLSQAIPVERTRPPYELPDALGDLSATISGLNTNAISDALDTLAHTFENTSPDLKKAVEGVARFSQILDTRDAQLRKLLANANKATSVLSERADEIVAIIGNTNALLNELRTQSVALQQLSGNLSYFTKQLSGFISDNRDQLRPALDKLNGVLSIVDNRKERLRLSLKYLNQYALSLGEAVGSGPFFKAYIQNLPPGQWIQPFVDAAFSDLGLDPNVLLPSELSDPQTGQPATPPLPVPYPRTGQGGEPNVTLPEAITGVPGDPRYPYREPLPAPPPGGPPPGPPAQLPGNPAHQTGPSPVHAPAPGEPSAEGGK